MDQRTQDALRESGVIDITTVGAKSGLDRRIEINFLHIGGRFFITGRPGRRRDWLANLKTNPDFMVHLKNGVTADVAATASVMSDPDERSEVLYLILTEGWGNDEAKTRHILPDWVESAPLIEFTVDV